MAHAIVTGGSVRVGKAISLALASAGYDIILVFNHSLSDANKVAAEVRARGRHCFMHRCDVSRKENIDSLFADISRLYDAVELLVNCASVFRKYSFAETSEQIYDDHMDTNLKGPFFLSQNFVRYIQKREYIKKASIVNIGDMNSSRILTGHFAYFLSKKGLHGLTQMIAAELPAHIRINSISPGRVLPPKGDNDSELDLSKYPRVKEISDAVLRFHNSTDNGVDIIIESDPNL